MNNNPEVIIVHTEAFEGGAGYDEVNRWHKNNGWSAPITGTPYGYHAHIEKNGKLVHGRWFYEQGAHTLGMNDKSIGVCFSGHGDYEELTRNQKETFIDFCRMLFKTQWNLNPAKIHGHNDYTDDKTCPGNKISVRVLRAMFGVI